MAEDVETQLFERLRAAPWYANQVDEGSSESTDVESRAILR